MRRGRIYPVTVGPSETPVRLQALRSLGYAVDISHEDVDVIVTVSKDAFWMSYTVGLWAYHEWLHGHDISGQLTSSNGRPNGMSMHEYETHTRIIGITYDNHTVPMEEFQRFARLYEMNHPNTWSSNKLELYATEEPPSPPVKEDDAPRFKPGRIIDLD